VGSENVVARHIGETALLIAAAPAYLERAGTPLTPDDLTRHACFTYAFSSTGNHWELEGSNGDPVSVRIGGPVKANNGMLLAEMAVAGSGIVYGPCFILLPLIERGQLVRLLPDWGVRRLPIHVVYPTRRHLSAKVQAMTGFLTEWFESRRDQQL
jgi:DNA-binding transcriptional LysR family regulator